MIEREYYPITAAAERLGCHTDDLIHLAANGKIRLGVLFETDGFQLENYFAYELQPGEERNITNVNCPEFDGFVFVDSGYFKSMERTGGPLHFNAIETRLGTNISIRPMPDENNDLCRNIDQIFITQADLNSLLAINSGSRQSKVNDNSLLATIAAMISSWPGGKVPSGKELEKAASAVGVKISDDTIRTVLKAANELVARR